MSCTSGFINLVVNYLKSESSYDYLTIYDGVSESGSQLYRGSGTFTTNVWSTSMKRTSLYILFTSDDYLNYDGYEIAWYCGAWSSGSNDLPVFSLCSAGTYSESIGATDPSTCLPCPSGKYSIVGSSICSACPKGSYSLSGASSCTLCPQGTYSDLTAATACVSCGTGMSTNSTGSASWDSCSLCPTGSYCAVPILTPSQRLYDR